jgi:hypothetical protein
MDKADNFERVFITLVAERVKAAKMSHSEFGRKIFGESAGVRLWRACRDFEGRGRRLTLDEAYRMADVLGTDFPTMVWNMVQEAKARGLLNGEGDTP